MEKWKSETIDRLKKHPLLVAAEQTIALQIEAERQRQTRVKAADMDKEPVHGGGSTREEQLLNSICRIDTLTAQLKETRCHVQAVCKALDALREDERHDLSVAYISDSRGGVERLREEYSYEDVRQVYRRLDSALYKFRLAMMGRADVW